MEENLHLAEKTARKAYKRARHEGIEFDVIQSQAYMGLIRGVADWDEDKSHDGKQGMGPFLVQHINWYILRLWRDSTDSHLIKPCGQQLPDESETFLLVEKTTQTCRQEVVEQVNFGLKFLTPRERALLTMVDGHDLCCVEAARSLGISRQYATDILREARRKFRASAKWRNRRHNVTAKESRREQFIRWKKDNPNSQRAAALKGAHRAIELRRQKTALSAVLYACQKSKWYAVDHAARTVTGPYRYRHQAEARHARLGHKGGAEHGWPNVGHMEAAVLRLLYEKPSPVYEIRQALGYGGATVRTFIYRLRSRGYLRPGEAVRRAEGLHGGRGGKRWYVTEKAIADRVRPVIGVMGEEAQRYLEKGYTPATAKMKGD